MRLMSVLQCHYLTGATQFELCDKCSYPHYIRAICARMDLERLKIFLAVFRAGGFASVARDLNVAPSSISRAIAGLEEDLRTRLFERSTRKLIPTEAGEDLFNRLSPVLDALGEALEKTRDSANAPTGRLRVTASSAFGTIVLPRIIAAFRAAYPEVMVELVLSDRPIDFIANRIDLGIRHGPITDTSLQTKVLRRATYKIVASPDYVDRFDTINQPKDLTDHHLLAFPFVAFQNKWQLKLNADQLFSIDISPVLTAPNAAVLLECACEGMGLAMLADWTVEGALQDGRLVQVLKGWQASPSNFDHPISLVFPSRDFRPAKTMAFAAFLNKSLDANK